MKKFFKHLIRWFIRIIVLTIILIGIAFYLLSDPSLFFNYNTTNGDITLHSDIPIQSDINAVMEKVYQRIKSLEIYDSTYQPTIYLINDQDTFAKISQLTPKSKYSFSLTVTFFNNIFINLTQVKSTFLNHNPNVKYTQLVGELDQIIAHEFINGLIAKKIGWVEHFRLPDWKKEGYCEYGSTIENIKKDDKHNLMSRTKILLDTDFLGQNNASVYYYRSQLYIEYLAEVHKMNFEQIVDLPVSYEDMTVEFEEWYYFNIQNKKLKR